MSDAVTREAVIGLEVHVQLLTLEKLFSAAPAAFGAPPNTHVDPVTLALPGALPVLNGEAVDLGVRTALALGATVHRESVFARKNYFYPDLPKGYQISQFDRPLATGGAVRVSPLEGPEPFAVRIRRLHLEEDAGKSIHDRFPDATAVDLNRAGVPLAEIVTEPDLHSPAEVRAFLDELKRILEYLEVSDCNMEEGSLRVDANVSIRPSGTTGLGTRTELKNMNSFSAVERALEVEIERQRTLVQSGGAVTQETLLWDARAGEVRSMRSKEDSHDYRYFSDPDLHPVRLDEARVEAIRRSLPELPGPRSRRLVETWGIPAYDAFVLTARRVLADYYESLVGLGVDPKVASNWVMGPALELANQRGAEVDELGLDSGDLARIVGLVEEGIVSHASGRRLLALVLDTGRSPEELVESEGMRQVSDDTEIRRWVDEVLTANPEEAERCSAGDMKLLGFLVGQVMRASNGAADPREVNRILRGTLGVG